MKYASSVDEYLALHPDWDRALLKLRKALASSGLEETIKWGAPCYTLDGAHVVGIAAFKSHVALWFHQGVFLADPDGVLVNAQEGKTKALRQWRFASEREIPVTRVRAYVREAIANQRAGRTIRPEPAAPVAMPVELAAALAAHRAAARAFAALTPGRQREYLDYVASAKQARTRASRAEKILPMIEAGLGLHDRYRGR
jgi:uncharacterized protein YdeI (YjbR/CyaY-like superfamily)